MIIEKVITPQNYDPEKFVRSISEKTMTIPDQSLTVKEILERFSVNMPPTGVLHEPIYDQDPDQDFADNYISPDKKQNFDLTDYDDIKEKVSDAEREFRTLPDEVKASFNNRKVG